MKKMILLRHITFIIVCLFSINFGFAQIVSWDMIGLIGNEATFNATTNNANLNTSILSRGSGIDARNLGNAFSSDDYTSNGTQTEALTNNDYFQFQISTMSGYQVSLNTLDANFRRSSNGPNTFIWRYSIDGINFTDIGSAISYIANVNNGTAQTQIDLSTITDLQNVPFGTTITIRLYGWNASTTNGTFAIGRLAGDDLSISGSVFTYCAGGMTTWNGTTWDNGTPDITTSTIIDGDYNTGNGGSEISFSACNLTINPGATLTVADNTFAEVRNNVDGAGNITVETQGNFVQNDDTGMFTVSGTTQVNKTTPSKNAWYYYTYWSSPVIGETVEDAFPNTPEDRKYWFNASNYLDTVGDDIDDNNDDWTIASGTMLSGIGYTAMSDPNATYPTTHNTSFIGTFNTGDVTTGIIYNAANVNESWNLIGNPYPSAIDFDIFQAANAGLIDGAVYFWSHSSPPDTGNPGNQQQNFDQSDYLVYTVGSGGTGSQYIPSGQSVFVSGIANGTATFTNATRTADITSNSLFYRNSNSKNITRTETNKLWVNLTSDNGVSNQILIAYVDGATNLDDGLYYDAPKLLSTNFTTALYTTIEESNKKFTVQGKASTSINDNEIINLGFATNIEVPTLYKLSIADLQGYFINANTIYLKDNLLNKLHNLNDTDYTFTSAVGEFNNRFQIVFNTNGLSIDEAILNTKKLSIVYLDNDYVRFNTNSDLNIKTITIFNLLGRPLKHLKGSNSSETYKFSNLHNAIYIAKVKLSNGTVISKKTVKK